MTTTGSGDYSFQFGVRNTGTTAINLAALSNMAWLQVVSFQGNAIVPDETRQCSVTVPSIAVQALSPGEYDAEIAFNDGSTTVGRFLFTLAATNALEDGWTVFTPSADTRVVYVSAAGNNANNGLTESTPKRTIAAGKALLRNNRPDWLLLRRGDTFNESLGEWGLNGRSASEPMLVSAYGQGERPVLNLAGLNPPPPSGMQMGYTPCSHVSFVSIELRARPEGNESGIVCYQPCQDILIEDCVVHDFVVGMLFQTTSTRADNIRFRRNIITDCFTPVRGGQGFYIHGVDNLLLEENLVDRNGWDPAIPNSRSGFAHQAYIHYSCGPAIARGNVFSRSGAAGLQLRSGGIAQNNLFTDCVVMLQFYAEDAYADVAEDNVFSLMTVTNPTVSEFSTAIAFRNPVNVTVRNNVMSNCGSITMPVSIWAAPHSEQGNAGVHNVLVQDNISYNFGPFHLTDPNYTGVSLLGNHFQEPTAPRRMIYTTSMTPITSANNRFWTTAATNMWVQVASNMSLQSYLSTMNDTTSAVQQVAYPDPTRDVNTYYRSLGHATGGYAELLTEMRRQRKGFWREAYTANAVNTWIRAGFGR